MPLTKLPMRPGINREVTDYTNEGGWYDCDKIRFKFGYPEVIGGWVKSLTVSLLGTCRHIQPWADLGGDRLLGFGTHLKFLMNIGGSITDITPVVTTTAAGAATFAAVDGSATLTVTHAAHGADKDDFVIFSDAAGLGGTVTADVLNQEYQIQSVESANTYTVTAREAAVGMLATVVDGVSTPTEVVANSSDTGNGGASVVIQYLLGSGRDTTFAGTGWGAGPWGDGGWGEPDPGGLFAGSIRLWSSDNWGEDLIINPRNGGLFLWDRSAGGTTRATNLADLASASDVPTVAKQVIVSDRSRHVIAFGCDLEITPGVQDPLAIRFSASETLTNWTSTASNTAGELRLGSGSQFVTAVETRQQILVFTDTTLYTLQYLGPPFTFGIQAVAASTTIVAPNAAVAQDDAVYWMGQQEFYVYAGTVQRLPCTLRKFVFGDLNQNQRDKIFAGLNTEHAEVWWFYPSAASDEVDRYIVYNILEDVWYKGTLSRTAWADRGVFARPLATDPSGYIYDQETGLNDGSENPSVALEPFITSSYFDISEGDRLAFVRRFLPDVAFLSSSDPLPAVTVTLTTSNASMGSYEKAQAKTYRDNASATGTQRTEQLFYRLRGRQLKLKVESNQRNVTWRLGSPRIDIRPDGKR